MKPNQVYALVPVSLVGKQPVSKPQIPASVAPVIPQASKNALGIASTFLPNPLFLILFLSLAGNYNEKIAPVDPSSSISFTLNGQNVTVANPDPRMR